jgi:hypothetical protein
MPTLRQQPITSLPTPPQVLELVLIQALVRDSVLELGLR